MHAVIAHTSVAWRRGERARVVSPRTDLAIEFVLEVVVELELKGLFCGAVRLAELIGYAYFERIHQGDKCESDHT